MFIFRLKKFLNKQLVLILLAMLIAGFFGIKTYAAAVPPDPTFSNFISQCNSNSYGYDCVALFENYRFLTNTAPEIFSTTLGELPTSLNAIGNSLTQLSLALLVLIFIIAIIYNAAGGSRIANYQLKKLLPRFFIASVMIFSSYFILSITVDVGNIVSNSLIGVFGGNDNTNSVCVSSTANPGDNLQKIAKITVPNLLCEIGYAGEKVAANVAPNGLNFDQGAVDSSFAGLRYLNYISTFAVVVASFAVALRYGLTIALTFLAPLAFVAWILPNTKTMFDKWLKALLLSLIIYPIFLLLFQISYQIITNIPESSPVSIILKTFFALIPFFIMPLGLWIGSFFSGNLVRMINQARSQKVVIEKTQEGKETKELESKSINTTAATFTKTQNPAIKFASNNSQKIIDMVNKNAANKDTTTANSQPSASSSSPSTVLSSNNVQVDAQGDIKLSSSPAGQNILKSKINQLGQRDTNSSGVETILNQQLSAIRDGRSLRALPSFGRIRTKSLGADNVFAKNFRAQNIGENIANTDNRQFSNKTSSFSNTKNKKTVNNQSDYKTFQSQMPSNFPADRIAGLNTQKQGPVLSDIIGHNDRNLANSVVGGVAIGTSANNETQASLDKQAQKVADIQAQPTTKNETGTDNVNQIIAEMKAINQSMQENIARAKPKNNSRFSVINNDDEGSALLDQLASESSIGKTENITPSKPADNPLLVHSIDQHDQAKLEDLALRQISQP